MSENDDLEAPLPDSVDQHQAVAEEFEANSLADAGAELPLDVNEADAAEQRREVRLDEDDYR